MGPPENSGLQTQRECSSKIKALSSPLTRTLLVINSNDSNHFAISQLINSQEKNNCGFEQWKILKELNYVK
jgi:hypothetical protein